MTKSLVDLSDYQAGLNVDTVAASVDGAWCKVGDWAWISRYGWPADDIHNTVVNRFLQLGKPVGSYLFVRPGWSTPATQIDAWRLHCPNGTTVAPMIDLEVNGTLSGNALRDWVDTALRRTAELFGMTPVLYWSNAFASAYGMSAPAAPHVPMCAEYHYGYQTQLWQSRATWESHAYSAYGGPDVPAGYSDVTSRSLIWQWTSSAQIPGFKGLVDHDWVPDAAWQLITSTSSDEDGFLMALTDQEQATLRDQVTALNNAINGLTWNNSPRWAEQEARVNTLYDAIAGATANNTPRWAEQEARVNFLYGLATAADRYPLVETTVAEILDVVNKLSAGSVDLDQLAGKVAAAVAAAGIKADVDEAGIARAVLDAFRAVWSTAGTGGGDPSPSAASDDLPDPNPERRAAAALADLATSVFDTDTGVAAVVSRQLAHMRPAPGVEVSNDDIAGAVEGALADAARRAGLKAESLPPVPPLPTPAGDMGGQPNT